MSRFISLQSCASCIGLPVLLTSSTLSWANLMLSWYGSATSGLLSGFELVAGDEGASGMMREAYLSALVRSFGVKVGFLSFFSLEFLLVPVSN